MSSSTTALVIVDLQNDYFPGGHMELSEAEAAAENARLAIEAFRTAARPVIHVRHEATSPGASFLLPDTPGSEIYATVAPRPGETVITKHFPNSFLETPLREELTRIGARSLVICGAMSHMCIDATTRAAVDLGFDCTVLNDACATRDLSFGDRVVAAEDVHAAFMAALSSAYANVMATSQYLEIA